MRTSEICRPSESFEKPERPRAEGSNASPGLDVVKSRSRTVLVYSSFVRRWMETWPGEYVVEHACSMPGSPVALGWVALAGPPAAAGSPSPIEPTHAQPSAPKSATWGSMVVVRRTNSNLFIAASLDLVFASRAPAVGRGAPGNFRS